jgi:hypothetical protein
MAAAARSRSGGGVLAAAAPAAAPALAFVGAWGRAKLLLGPPRARSAARILFAAAALAALARAGVALGAPRATVRGLAQMLLLLLLWPLLTSAAFVRTAVAVALARPGTRLPPPGAARLRFEMRPLADAAAVERVADLLCTGAFPQAGPAPAALRALARAGAMPRTALLLEVYAQPRAAPAAAPARRRWWLPWRGRDAGGYAEPAPQPSPLLQPNRLLALAVAHVAPRVDAAPLTGGRPHPLLGPEASLIVLEVPVLGWPGFFVTREVDARRAAALLTASVAHLTARLGVAAALAPPPAGGAPSPFAAAALAACGAHALPPALGAPPDTHVIAISAPLRGCGSVDAFASAALRRSARRDMRVKRRRFAAAGGAVAVAPPDALLREPALAAMLLGQEAAATLQASPDATTGDDGSPPPASAVAHSALALVRAAAQASSSEHVDAAAPPLALRDALRAPGEGALPAALCCALLSAPPDAAPRRAAWLLVARAPGGVPAAAMMLLRDAASGLLCAQRTAAAQPLARDCGASAALLRGALELALVLGASGVDLGPGDAGGAKARLGAIPMPRTPLLLFSDDRLAAAHTRSSSSSFYAGLLRDARDAAGARPRPPPPPRDAPSARQMKRARARQLRAGAAAEAARDAARMAAASAADVRADDVGAFHDAASVAGGSSVAAEALGDVDSDDGDDDQDDDGTAHDSMSSASGGDA